MKKNEQSHRIYQHMHDGNSEKKEAENIFKDIMAEKSPNLMKFIHQRNSTNFK